VTYKRFQDVPSYSNAITLSRNPIIPKLVFVGMCVPSKKPSNMCAQTNM